jgi:hypothetical protein
MGVDVEAPMDVSLLKLKSMFRHAAGRKGTLLAQALRKQDARQDAAVVAQPLEPATQPAGEQVRVRELAHMDLMSHEDGQKHRAR